VVFLYFFVIVVPLYIYIYDTSVLLLTGRPMSSRLIARVYCFETADPSDVGGCVVGGPPFVFRLYTCTPFIITQLYVISSAHTYRLHARVVFLEFGRIVFYPNKRW